MALSTPAAIVVGSVIIGACIGTGVFLALRGQHGEHAPRAANATDVAPSTLDQATSNASPASASPASDRAPTLATAPTLPAAAGPVLPSDAVTLRARSEASAQFDRARAALVAACIPRGGGHGEADVSHFRMHVVVDAQGEQLGRSFLENGAARTGLAQCVNATLPPLALAPPGVRVTFEVPVTLP